MKIYDIPSVPSCPESVDALKDKARQLFEKVLTFCESNEFGYAKFEIKLFPLMAVLGRVLIQLFLLARHLRLDLKPYLEDGKYRLGCVDAERTLKTAYGTIS